MRHTNPDVVDATPGIQKGDLLVKMSGRGEDVKVTVWADGDVPVPTLEIRLVNYRWKITETVPASWPMPAEIP